MMKKLWSMMLCLCLVLTFLPGTARADYASGTCGNNVEWTLENGVLTISGTGAMRDYNAWYDTSTTKTELIADTPWFDMRTSIRTVKIEDGVTTIGAYAFLECESLTQVTIPDTVARINRDSFCICTSLRSVTIPNGVSVIDVNTFNSCSSLTQVAIPDTVTRINSQAFIGCKSLTDIRLPKNLSYIGKAAFVETGLTSVELPEGLTTIAELAFDRCADMRRVSIPESVETIGNEAFSYCTGLTTVVIPGSVRTIGSGAFSSCTSLTDVTISDGVQSIGMSAFGNCNSLTAIHVPSSVTSIGSHAFAGSQVREILVDHNNPRYCSIDGALYTKDLSALVMCPEGKTGKLVIPEGVTTFESGEYSGPLYDCQKLTGLTIPGSVTTTGFVKISEIYGEPTQREAWGTFINCLGLTSAGPIGSGCDIEFGWTSAIPDGTFERAAALKTVILPDGLTSLEYTFSGCTSLETVHIPDSIKTIGKEAFYGCTSLSTLVIPDGVTMIGRSAFRGCTGLTSLTIPKSVTDIDPYGLEWGRDCPDLTIYCYSGSAAHQYAERFQIRFELLDGNPPSPAVSVQSVTLTRDGGTVDLLTHQANFIQGSEETASVAVAVDWDSGEIGRAFLIQDRDTWVELTSQPAGITPGTTFHPNPERPIYVIATDTAASTILDWKLTNLRITGPEPEPEPEDGTGLLVKDGFFAYRPNFIDTVDAMFGYHYDEHWFLESGYTYQHDLVKMSIRGAMSAFGAGYDSNGRNIELLMKDLEFNPESITINYPKTETDSIGYAIASKNITPAEGDDFEPFSLIMLTVRGGGYYEEWRGNFHIGTGEEHEGFRIAANKVLSGLKTYLNRYDDQLNENKKIWLMGFSRGSTVTNLVAKDLDNNAIPGLSRDNLYAFCFACPQNSRASETENQKYDNITNIVNPIDPVPKLVMSEWGFSRYGKTFYLPYIDGMNTADYKRLSSRMESVYSALTANFPGVTASRIIPGGRSQTLLTDFIATRLASLWKNQTYYLNHWQDSVYTIVDAFFVGRAAKTDGTFSSWSQYASFIADVLVSEPLSAEVQILISEIQSELEELDFPTKPADVLDYPHYSELYLAWLDALEGERQYADSKYRIVYVNCPVDVQVKDSDGALVGEVINNKVSDVADGVAILVDFDGQKVIMLPNHAGYTINLTATAGGEVTYTATEYDMDTGRTEKVVSYYEVEVEAGDKLTGTVENLDNVPAAAYPLVLNSESASLTPDVQQSGGDVQMCSVELSADGSGVVTGGGTYVNGEFAKVEAIPDRGETFLGWYIQDRFVSNEPEYRFLVRKDVHITARFTDTISPAPPESTSRYTVIFDSQGGSAVRSQSISSGGRVIKPADPTRSGYTFGGWYTDSSCTNTWNFDADTVTSSITLYARWTHNDGGGGSSSGSGSGSGGGSGSSSDSGSGSSGGSGSSSDSGSGSSGGSSSSSDGGSGSNGGGGSSSSSHSITVPSHMTGGTVKVSPSSASAGTKVTITATPNSGYELNTLTVTNASGNRISLKNQGNHQYTFTMPNGAVTVNAVFEKTQVQPKPIPFTDVSVDDWCYDAVEYAYIQGIMNGTTETTFTPNGLTTRGMIVTILHRLEGTPSVLTPSGFSDVAMNRYCTDAVAWGAANGLVCGYQDGTFHPDASLSRQQMAAILYRYAQLKGYATIGSVDISSYPDNASVASYAHEAMAWAVGNDILTGTSEGRLNPAGMATRAQFAAVMYRFAQKVAD